MKRQHNLNAVVFDVDGVLLDTREFAFQAFEDTLSRFGHPMPSRDKISQQMGRSLEQIYMSFVPNGDPYALSKAHEVFQNTPEKLKLITLHPDVSEMLQELRESGIKLAVFSSRKTTLLQSLTLAGIAEFFEIVVQGDEVTQHKPHPEGLFKALAGLEVKPQNAAMIGDAVVDILAGKAAGVALTIGITHGYGTLEEITEAQPDCIVASAKEIPPLIIRDDSEVSM